MLGGEQSPSELRNLNAADNNHSTIGNAESSITLKKINMPREWVTPVKCGLGLSCSRKRETHVLLIVTSRTCTFVLVSVRRTSPACFAE